MSPKHTCKKCGTTIWAFSANRLAIRLLKHYMAFYDDNDVKIAESECKQIELYSDWKGSL